MRESADAIVVGAGLAGLVAACELIDAGKHVVIVEQEPEASFGGQSFWSLGGLFLIDSPEQRRLGVRDSRELAHHDWMLTAGFDRDEDTWPRRWAEAYLDFAAGEKRSWVHERGIRFFPVVGMAERRAYPDHGPGNSVPRFHVTWGTGPGVLAPFARRVRDGVRSGLVSLHFRHRVTEISVTNGAVDGVSGDVLADDPAARGERSSRSMLKPFELHAPVVIVASGGIGANLELVRASWPTRLGTPPADMLCGVPDHVDGAMIGVTEAAGGNIINRDRMWHYTEGVQNWAPIWTAHGIRILPGPSSLWIDAVGNRIPAPLFPGSDTLGTLDYIMKTGFAHTWFILTQQIIEKEFALSGSEQNPDITGKSIRKVLARVLPGAPPPIEAFKQHGADFIVENDLPTLVRRMNALTGESRIDHDALRTVIAARDAEIADAQSQDMQVRAIHSARADYIGDRLTRVAKPHRLLDPDSGPLIAVRLRIVTRKTLGGIQTDLQSRVLREDGEHVPGLFAVGEAAGFGGGGMHGYRALEGTFLGGCIFSGRTAGRAAG
ncbi:MAG: FAD-binding dehydrogenase [Longimicrobiales bacterium]